jgi:ubiquinone/menaquinone biosynthesis C-methylase UbiE
VTAGPPPKPLFEAFYDDMTGVYDPPMTARHYLEDDRYGNVVAAVAEGPTGQRILDVAGGNGWLASLYRGDHAVIALDIADANLRRMQALGLDARKHNLDHALPFADAAFDTVVCSEILEHVFRPDLVLREAMRVLRPGGRVIVTVPNLHCLRNRLDMLLGKRTPFIEFRIHADPTDQISLVGVQHIRHFSFAAMRSVLQDIGFERLRARGQSFHLNGGLPLVMFSALHGGNRGLRWLLPRITFGRVRHEHPGLVVRLWLIRRLAGLMPGLSPGMMFVAVKPQPAGRPADVPPGTA